MGVFPVVGNRCWKISLPTAIHYVRAARIGAVADIITDDLDIENGEGRAFKVEESPDIPMVQIPMVYRQLLSCQTKLITHVVT